MAKIACCYNCVFAFLDREHTLECYEAGILNWPACANHPDSYGRLRRTPEQGICPNYRPKPPVPQGESVKTISLGGGFVTYVDAADFEWLNQWTWYLNGGYAVRREKNRVISMHRQIMQPPKGMVVHHKSRNKLDNTRENMENTTQAENMRDRSKPRNCSSRLWGVSYTKQRAKYQASAHYQGKAVACGWFTDEIEAARAHDYKAVELKGELARLNFPEEWPPERRAQVYAQGAAERQRVEARARQREAAKKAPRKTSAAQRRTKPKPAPRRKPRTRRGDACVARTRKAERREKGKETRTRPRATRDEKRTTRSKRATAAKRPKRKAT